MAACQALFTVRSVRQLMQQITYNSSFAGSWGWTSMPCMGRDGVHQKPPPVAGRRHCAPLSGDAAERSKGVAAAVVETFLARWHADRSLGQHGKFSSQVCRAHSMNDASFYKWRENMGHGRVYGVFDEGHENENRRVEKMFAQLSMQNDLLTSPLPVALRALSARLTLSSTIKADVRQ
jgi:hypothetical protein